ncbi:ABC transporter permease [uncultured Azohydromonas sp.]|jgi:ABC-type polysaccharide/polyol phosphate export systems, permease component|uniref:ABC transporter permease n=1 Tax=uncultured Azohydromonas sp. TaxID=487342 RepID=UPI002618A6C4|nr:ABC transporter permease [uncultured Azohydromonas sp.]
MSALSRGKRSPLEIQRAVLFALFVRELKTRFEGSWTGFVWVLLEPLGYVLVMSLLLGSLHHTFSPSIAYPVFLVTGMLPFFLFRNLAFRLMDAVDANLGLFVYRQVKPMDAIVSRAMLEVVLLSVVYALTLLVLMALGYDVLPARPLELMGVSALLVLLGFSMGLFFAVATHGVPRVRAFIRVCRAPLYFLSGVIFAVHALPEELRKWLLWNPVLHLLELTRGCFFPTYPVLPEVNTGYVTAFTLIFLVLGLCLYRVRRQQLITLA